MEPSSTPLIHLRAHGAKPPSARALLVKPPFFTPWTPPLGIGILKAYGEQAGHRVKCLDLNTDAVLWQTHHEYFRHLSGPEHSWRGNDGYTALWWILNAHMLAYANDASASSCEQVVRAVAPMYGVALPVAAMPELIAIVDRFYARLRQRAAEVNLASYSFVGTSTYTTSLGPSLFLLREWKKRYPHLRTVMGGGVFADDLAIGSDNLATLLEYDFVDHIIIGEGEQLFVRLMEGALAHKRLISLADIQGETLEMRDIPAPDFSDFEIGSYYHLSIEGARSCPFQCSFCSETVQWGKYRMKPIDQLARQVGELADRFGNNTYFMGDSLMNPYIQKFSAALIQQGIKVLYDGYLRADKPIADRVRTAGLAQSGMFRARLGIESASAHVLDLMQKMTSPATISEVLKSLANAGVRPTTYWIVGFPGETQDDFEETLDFIRAHHRHIYELEAHPYYYYPYGQIGSRLFECVSLYPDSVTEVIRFRAWEPVKISPTRRERYERLRKISDVAASLGLPNIYTMEDRYAAEERWQRLHPCSIEVYEGTSSSRVSQAALVPELVTSRALTRERARGPMFWALRLRVSTELEPRVVLAAIVCLLEGNEVLRVTRTHAGLVPTEAAAGEPECMLCDHSVEPANATALASQLTPTRGSSFRIALGRSIEGSELLMLGHPDLVDAASLGLLAEDAFRACEQIAHGLRLALLPGPRPIHEWAPLIAPMGDQLLQSARTRDSVGVAVDLDEFGRALTDCGLSMVEAFLLAIVRATREATGDVEVHALVDRRTVDSTLARTAGPLTRRCALRISPGLGLASPDVWAPEIKRALAQAVRDEEPSPDAETPVVWNLEGLCGVPWLGGDAWRLVELFPIESAGSAGDAIELAPALDAAGIRIHFFYGPRQSTEDCARSTAAAVVRSLNTVVEQCRSHAATMQFWRMELKRVSGWLATTAHILMMSTTGELVPIDRLRRTEAMVGPPGCGVDVLLCAYAAVLARWCESSNVVITLCGFDHPPLPICITAAPDMCFSEIVDWMRRRRSEVLRAAGAYETLRRRIAPDLGAVPFAFRTSSADLAEPVSCLELCARMTDDEKLTFEFTYDPVVLSTEVVHGIATDTADLIVRALVDPDRVLVGTVSCDQVVPPPTSEGQSFETFSFDAVDR